MSKKTPATIQALRSVESQAKRTASAVDKVFKATGGALGRKSGGGSGLPAELQRNVNLSRQMAAEMGRGLKIETQQAQLLREQTRARTEGVRLAREEARLSEQIARATRPASRPPAPPPLPPRRAAYRPGDWMHDSDRPPDWRRELGDTRPPRRRGHGPDAPDGPHGAGRVERFGQHAGRARDAAHDFGDAYGQARASIQTYTDPAAELMRSRARLGALGLSGDETARAEASIKRVVAEVKGARLADTTQAFAELYEVFGSVEDTARNLPRAAQYSFSLKTLHGDRYNSEQLTGQTKSAYKFVDLLGLTKPDAQGRVDHARVDAYHDQMMQVLSATGGDVDPRKLHDLAKIGGSSLLGMNREGLTHMAALAGDVGGSRAGNLQRSLFQSFAGGKLFPRHVQRLKELGLLDESKVLKKTGGKYELMPGAIRGAETISADPLPFADRVSEALRRKGVDTSNESQVVNAVAGLTGNTLAQQALSQLIIRRGEITRFDEIVSKAEALPKLYARASSLPLGSIEDAKAKQENWRATAGGQMLMAGGSLSSILAPVYADLQSFAEGRPVMAAALAGISGLGRASVSAGEGVGTLAGLLRELRGGGGGATGSGILGTGLDGSDALAAGWGVGKFLKWGGRGLLAAGGAIGGAAATPYVAAALATTAGGVGLYTRHRAGKAGEAADTARAGLFESARTLREQAGGRLPDRIAQSLGSTAFEQLNRAGDLTTKIEPGLYGAYQRVYDPSPYRGWLHPFDGERASGVFRQRAPELAFPEVMRSFVADVTRRVGAGQISPEAGQRTLKTAEAAFPDTFKQASAEAAGALGKLPEPSTQAAKALSEILTPSRALPASLAHLGGSLDALAFHVNALEIRAPSITLPGVGGSTADGKPPGGGRRWPADDLLTIPRPKKSAVGSVVERDGLVHAHKGNVIFPAALSRRSPGDWLDSADAMRGADEGAGAVDYSAFQAGGGAGGGHTFNVQISVPAGSAAAEDPAELARLMRAELARLAAELAETRADVYDPRFHGNMVARELNWQRERV